MNFGIFCAARPGTLEKWRKVAFDVGRSLAANGHSLIYGAGKTGLMDSVAKGFDSINRGSYRQGISTSHLEQLEGATAPKLGGDTLTIVETMFERKRKYNDISDVYIVLPGGYGTFDELLDMMVLNIIGEQFKPILIFDPLRKIKAILESMNSLFHEYETIASDADMFDAAGIYLIHSKANLHHAISLGSKRELLFFLNELETFYGKPK